MVGVKKGYSLLATFATVEVAGNFEKFFSQALTKLS
jgi:hypothetical protein